jgi:hypothetical protein
MSSHFINSGYDAEAEPEPESAEAKPEGVSSVDDIVYRKGEIAKKVGYV